MKFKLADVLLKFQGLLFKVVRERERQSEGAMEIEYNKEGRCQQKSRFQHRNRDMKDASEVHMQTLPYTPQ